MSAFNQRLQPLRELMKEKCLESFVLRRNPNLAWAIAGRAHVPTTIDLACFDLIVTHTNIQNNPTNQSRLKMLMPPLKTRYTSIYRLFSERVITFKGKRRMRLENLELRCWNCVVRTNVVGTTL
jgi:hypothetical protein